jgi:endoglucanase
MILTNAMVAAVLLRFLDPFTAVEQTDDANIGASWAGQSNYWPMAVGLADPLAPAPQPSLAVRAARKVVPAVGRRWESTHWRQPRILHARFLTYDEPPAGYDPEEPSPLFKVNQVGYMPDAPKFAYVGGWLGPDLGPWKPREPMTGWQLVDAETGKVVKDSKKPPLFRVPDGTTPEGVPFTGEETYEMDFSKVKREGEYYLRIPSVGRSANFRIWRGAAEAAFRVHMGGLYQKRCGIAKEEPYTHWTAGACHTNVVRGTFPPGEGKLAPDVGWFAIIRDNTDWKRGERLHLAGGWHDAADYDRRPQHVDIVNDLCAVYLMRPGNFRDGQLAIPENANGIPDILDEAEWGLRHLLAGQQEDGGVGTWVESTAHPGPGNVAERDRMPYALSRATRRSSLAYAAHAALLVRCDGRFREKYLGSAERAWDFAMREKPRSELFEVRRKEGRFITSTVVVYWDEDKEWPATHLVKAALNLHALTGDGRYLETLEAEMPRLMESMGRNGWSWRPLTFSGEMALGTPPAAASFFEHWKRRLLKNADEVLQQMETAYAYRAPWHAPQTGWVHTMGYGRAHPLVQAQKLVAAHGATGEAKYLEVASLANDFHNGCNPMGSTLTSGLGEVYPVAFLDFPSYVDGIAEYVPGITPYRWTYGLSWKIVQRVFGGDKERASQWPIWRRWSNMENQTVTASEYTVSDTIGPAASVTGYLLSPSGKPPPPQREPARALRDLPGYWVLP